MSKTKEEYLYGPVASPARILSDNRLSEQNDTIIIFIKNKKFNEVIVKPHTGATLQLKAKTHQQGDFSESDVIDAILASKYQEVTATVVDGNIIKIVREESILILHFHRHRKHSEPITSIHSPKASEKPQLTAPCDRSS